jgi:hypothetical protein
MIKAYTKFSVYEIDMENKKIRRTVGVNAPTPRQGEDNVWKEVRYIDWKEDGMLIVWPGLNEDGSHPCTWTSRVLQVESDDRRTFHGPR